MRVSAIKTPPVMPNDNLFAILDVVLPKLNEHSIVAIASKIVAICEGRVVAMQDANKSDLIRQEASHYLPAESNPYHVAISIVRNHLVASGGVDESNSGENYVLWPADLQKSVNTIRDYLCKKHGVTHIGVILTDSTSRPFQWGTTGIGIAYSGFKPLKNYIGTQDIFGREFKCQRNNIMNGLAAAAVLLMGEGDEQTPIAVIDDIPFVEFQPRNPNKQELADLHIDIENDLYATLLKSVPWQHGVKS